MTGTILYNKWQKMKARCNNIKHPAYKNYGGRGITVCEEWTHDFMLFYTWAIDNGYKEGLALDRRDNNKGYSPDNCRFVTHKENDNNKRTNRYVTINGVSSYSYTTSRG